MIFSNQTLHSVEQNFEFGSLHQIILGEADDFGRNIIHLTCTSETFIRKGMNPALTISFSQNNNPKIIKKRDNNLYMLLSTKGGSTLYGNGVVLVLSQHRDQFEVLSRARSADGPDYYIGHWDHLLIKVPSTDAIVQVHVSGNMHSIIPSDLYVIHQGNVHHCTWQTLEMLCSYLGIEVPCEVFPAAHNNAKLGGTWVRL